ncbi:hypothetical protein SBY92_004097 [Candida maltosa Xu316]
MMWMVYNDLKLLGILMGLI